MNRRLLYVGIPLAAALIGFFIYQSLVFKITGTTPDTNNVSVISPFLDIHFSKALDKNSIDVTSVDTVISGKDIVNEKTLRVYFDNLILNSDNSVVINSVRSKSGKEIRGVKYSFKAKDIPFDRMSQAQQKAILRFQDQPTPNKSDPILSSLPYGGLHFELTAEVNTDNKLILHARLLLSAADARSDANAATERYKKEVVEWIKSKELDPAKYTIEYEIIQPSIY